MIDAGTMAAILDSLKDPILFADTEHTTRYLNRAAIKHYESDVSDPESLIGHSLLDCHNEQSQQMMIEFLRTHRDLPEMARLIRAYRPPKWTRSALQWLNPRLLGDIDEVSDLVSELEGDNKGVPILVRKYLV